MIAGQAVVQHPNIVLSQVLSQSSPISIPVPSEFQQKLPVVTSLRDMENSTVASDPITPWHGRTIPESNSPLQPKKDTENRR
jgi:hypothetical protein